VIADPEGGGYYGRFKIDSYLQEVGMTVGEALVSTMRFYAPVVLKILEKHWVDVTGLVHNMGGGLTKCLRVGRNINFVKDSVIEPDPIFKTVQKESKESWKSMFEIFNMGTGYEIIAKPQAQDEILGISEKFGLAAKVIGRCERSRGQNMVIINCSQGKFQYQRG